MSVDVSAVDKSGLTYQWYNGWGSSRISGANSAEYVLDFVEKDETLFRCAVEDLYGNSKSVNYGIYVVNYLDSLQEGNSPVIAVTDVPALGNNGGVSGRVFMENGKAFEPEDYRISMFFQIEKRGSFWVKPYYNNSYTRIKEDGSFVGYFITGGNDRSAEIIHVMLIPREEGIWQIYASRRLHEKTTGAVRKSLR